MGSLTVKQEIMKQLDYLPTDLQRRVLDFAQALVMWLPRGVHGKQLLRFAGAIEAEDVQKMTEAIDAGSEQVDLDG